MLVRAVRFTCRSSTGSRRVLSALETPNLRCPRNGKQTSPKAPLSPPKPLVTLKQVSGKAVKVASASPDTGQQGGPSQDGP